MERIVAIISAIREGRYLTKWQFAEELEVSKKTIQRDIVFIRDRLNFPIDFCIVNNGYYFTEEVESGLEEFALQVEDIAALCLARHTMGALKGTKLAEAMRPTFDKLSVLAQGKVNLSSSDLNDVFSVRTAGKADMDLTLFGKMAEAVLKQNEISFMYQSAGQDKPTRRRVQPYHVSEVDGGWYMIGLDVSKNARRTYSLHRMKQCKVLKSKFERPEGLECSFAGGIGVWSSDETYKVKLRVSGWVFRIVQERVWHHTQEVEIINKKKQIAEVRMQVSGLEELVSLVLSWGSHVKIISPKKLLQLVRAEVNGMQH